MAINFTKYVRHLNSMATYNIAEIIVVAAIRTRTIKVTESPIAIALLEPLPSISRKENIDDITLLFVPLMFLWLGLVVLHPPYIIYMTSHF